MSLLEETKNESRDQQDQQNVRGIQQAVLQTYQGMHLSPVEEQVEAIADRPGSDREE